MNTDNHNHFGSVIEAVVQLSTVYCGQREREGEKHHIQPFSNPKMYIF